MANEISRRRAIQVGVVGAIGVAAGGVGTWRSFLAPASGSLAGRPAGALSDPEVFRSSGGTLDVRLTAASGATVAGRQTRAMAYNGSVPGPTIQVRPGDRLRVTLVNDLSGPTNLHTHGLHVSPEGIGDNIFRHVEAGQTAIYEYEIPSDHPAGTFWYHPHLHGAVADQVFAGLYGAIVVTGPAEPEVARERVMVVSDITLNGDGSVASVSSPQVMAGREGELVLINGQLNPRIDMATGDVERWRVVNACTSRFLRLSLEGHTLGFLGYDGQALGPARDRDAVMLAPGNRVDMLVRPSRSGTFSLDTLAVDRGGMGMMMSGGTQRTSGAARLATIQVARRAAATELPPAPPSSGPARRVPDLRLESVDQRRAITFTMGMGMGGMSFGFDGQSFDPSRTDQRLRMGALEEWTIANDTPMDHPFHLHVWPMQLVDGPEMDPSDPPDWRDVVVVPARSQIRVRVRVADYRGRTVYHCHILDHEDHGMMGVAEAS